MASEDDDEDDDDILKSPGSSYGQEERIFDGVRGTQGNSNIH